MGLIVITIPFRLWISYLNYLTFGTAHWRVVEGIVVGVRQKERKNHRRYWVLKGKGEGLTLYTTTYHLPVADPLNRPFSIEVPTQQIPFSRWLTGFYSPPIHLFIGEPTPPFKWVLSQHRNPSTGHLFEALFFGGGVPEQLRRQLGSLGVAPLVALSGLHLGIISGLLLLLLYYPYRLLHYRYFPHRNLYYDLGVVILGIEFLYLLFTHFPPSLVRAYGMEVAGFLLLYYRLSFHFPLFLALTLWLSFLISPAALLSLGFFFSIWAIYLIFLYFHHLPVTPSTALFLPFYLAVGMIPAVHHFFPPLSPYFPLSPFLSLLFPLLYIGELLLHLFQLGGVLDPFIENYLRLGEEFYNLPIPNWFFYSYLGWLLLSYRCRRCFLLAPGVLGGVWGVGVWLGG